ncbi:site-specific integrase [Natroniella sp. ANB-PHB2]|uniref:site-specific integrase n=1 Tax=Natroniella sp. ANB-PHB2 TaxID=3384444 RepID=UPI0038D454CC
MLSGGRLIFKEPKTSSSIRPIDINDNAVQILKNRQIQQKENKLRLADSYNNDYDLIFLKENGNPYLPDYASKQFKKLTDKIQLEKFRLHDLRHTHASLMLKAGVHPKIVQERLGHSSINQTLDTYSHIIPTMQKEAVKQLDNILEN